MLWNGLEKEQRGTEKQRGTENIIYFESVKNPKKSKIKNHLKKSYFENLHIKENFIDLLHLLQVCFLCFYRLDAVKPPIYGGGCFTSARIPEQPQRVQCDTFHSHLLIFILFPFKKLYPLQTLNY